MGDYFVHESSYIDDDVQIGKGTKIWFFCHVQAGARIGEDCSMGQNVNVGNNVVIGNRVKIQNNVSVYEGVTLEDDVFCGPSAVFTNDLFPRAHHLSGTEVFLDTTVERGASIGANATIVCGSRVGRWAMIASGSVVTKDVKPYSLMIGVPARRVGWVCQCGRTLPSNLCCGQCGRVYIQNEEVLKEGER